MNCLIYLRVSTKEQAEEGYSIPAQKEACIKYIQDNGWNFVDCFIDRGESARSARRPQLQEMLSRIKKDSSIDAVVVHKIDRLARNMEDHVAIKAILRRSGVSLVSCVEHIENSASGRLVEGIHALMAEFYSANLAMETRKGMTQKAKNGGYPGPAPVGYKNMRNEKNEALIVPDPEMAALVKEAFELYATGEYPISKLHEEMAVKGLKSFMSSTPIHRSRLAKLLKNKVYIGIVTWDNIEYSGIHEPLISKALFAKVQEVFSAHDKAGVRIRKHPHYLKGTLYCGYCGSRLCTTLAKGTYVYFFCLGKKRGNNCKQSHIPVEAIEEGILKLYKDIQLPKDVIEGLTLDLEQELLSRESFNLKQREFVAKKMAKLNKEREKLLQAFYAAAIPLELMKKEQDRISFAMTELETKQIAVSSSLDQVNRVIRIAIKMASNCYMAYEKAAPSNKRLLNQTIFEKIFIKDKDISSFGYTQIFDQLFSGSGSISEPLVPRRRVELLSP